MLINLMYGAPAAALLYIEASGCGIYLSEKTHIMLVSLKRDVINMLFMEPMFSLASTDKGETLGLRQ